MKRKLSQQSVHRILSQRVYWSRINLERAFRRYGHPVRVDIGLTHLSTRRPKKAR